MSSTVFELGRRASGPGDPDHDRLLKDGREAQRLVGFIPKEKLLQQIGQYMAAAQERSVRRLRMRAVDFADDDLTA